MYGFMTCAMIPESVLFRIRNNRHTYASQAVFARRPAAGRITSTRPQAAANDATIRPYRRPRDRGGRGADRHCNCRDTRRSVPSFGIAATCTGVTLLLLTPNR